MQPTIALVAKRAEVSLGTASKVLNGKEGVHPVLRQRVLAVARELGYHPNGPAQALRTGRSRALGLCVSLISNPTMAAIMESAVREAFAAGYELTICAAEYEPALELAHLDALARQRVAAVITFATSTDPTPYVHLQASGIPVVFGDHAVGGVAADLVAPDHGAGILAATRHLLSTGRRRIALLTASPDLGSTVPRVAGYQAAYQELGLQPPAGFILAGRQVPCAARPALVDLLAGPEPPDAVVASTGLLTLGAFGCLRERGIAIPRQVAFVGTGDVPWAAWAEPPLTMVEVPGEAYGRALVRAALERIDTSAELPPARETLLPVRLAVRASSGPAQTQAPQGSPANVEQEVLR